MDIELVIIGAGISGISMARAAQKGIKYIILESYNKWGGVWNSAFECTCDYKHIGRITDFKILMPIHQLLNLFSFFRRNTIFKHLYK